MKATFIGVPGEDHDALHMYGQTFPLGKAVKVESTLAQRKLANHPHFEVTVEPLSDAEDAQIKREFAGAAEAVLAPIEANKAEEEATQAALTAEEKYGNADATAAGDPNPAKAEGGGSAGRGRAGRRGQSS